MLPIYCPCCSSKTYNHCCRPLHDGQPAADAEALMRSRFSAHCLALTGYIHTSWAASKRSGIDQSALTQWLSEAKFGQLKVREHIPDPTQSTVEFECWYRQGGQLHHLHDRSHFIVEEGFWRYLDSSEPLLAPTRLRRNDPCPCASGKKLKHCCLQMLAD